MLNDCSSIKVIDLFAGPGGLSEGFSAFKEGSVNPFKIRLSIEKDPSAFATLQLRSFFRQFDKNNIPEEYYKYLKKIIKKDELFSKYPQEYDKAREETWLVELGSKDLTQISVNQRINNILKGSDLWVLIGGPPCQAYSLMGRVKIKDVNKKKQMDFEKDHRHFLYREYLKIIAFHKPPIFIMENVPGILSAKTHGENIFDKILEDLESPVKAVKDDEANKNDYNILTYKIYSLVNNCTNLFSMKHSDYIIKCENFGIPQARHRVILMGIRSDLETTSDLLKHCEKQYSIIDAIGDLPKIRSKFSKEEDSNQIWQAFLKSIQESKWFKEANMEDSVKKEIVASVQNNIEPLSIGGEFISSIMKSTVIYPEWFIDKRLKGVCNHSARGHIHEDLYRYFFATCFAKVYGYSPKIKDFPEQLYPKHKNIDKAIKDNLFSDRFRVQVKDKPSTTITCHISKDGHYYIHPDSSQCRSLTVREAARIQTFPDNYYFEGNRTEQYHQVGNAVPPLLAKEIARLVWEIIKKNKKKDNKQQN